MKTEAYRNLIGAARVMLDADPSSINKQAEAAAALYKAVSASEAEMKYNNWKWSAFRPTKNTPTNCEKEIQ